MECSSCRAPLADDAQFCHRCGASATGLPQSGDERVPVEAREQFRRRARGSGEQSASGDRPSPGRGNSTGLGAETVLWHGTYSAKDMILSWLLAALSTVAALVVWALNVLEPPFNYGLLLVSLAYWIWLFLVWCYHRLSVRYELSDQRLLHYHGLLHRFAERIELIDIDDIGFDQSLLERIVNVGRVTIRSSDRSHPTIVLRGIDRVAEVSHLIDDARRRERISRGIFVESI